MTKTYNKSKRVNFLRTLGRNAQGVPLLLARVPLVRWMRRVIHKTRRTGILTNPIKKSIITLEGIYSLVAVKAKALTRPLLRGSRRIFVNLSSKLRLLRQKERATMRSTLKGRIAAVAATFVVALGLAACGGGGGSDSFATVPTPAPVASVPSWGNAPIAASAGTEAAKLRNGALAAPADPYAGVDPWNAIEQLLDFGERNYPQYFPDHRATAVYEKFRYRYYPATGIYLGVAYGVTQGDGLEESGVYVMGGEFGNSPTHVGMLLGFITPAIALRYTSWWNGTQVAIYPMGTKVLSANQLPAGCTSTLQQCWRESVLNGTVKFIETSAVMVGLSNGRDTRPIVFAYYVTADGTKWDTQPFYSDTGDPTVGNGSGNLTGGGSFVVDWLYGNSQGTILHALNACYQFKWFPAGDPGGNANVWATEPVACP